jgi:hypothetical protein
MDRMKTIGGIAIVIAVAVAGIAPWRIVAPRRISQQLEGLIL